MLAAGAGCVELVDALLTLGELQVMDVARPSIRGETALHSAAASHNFETCKMLVERTNLQLKGAEQRLMVAAAAAASHPGAREAGFPFYL